MEEGAQRVVEAAERLLQRDPQQKDLTNYARAAQIEALLVKVGADRDDPAFRMYFAATSRYHREIADRLHSRIVGGDAAMIELCANMILNRSGLLQQELNRIGGKGADSFWSSFYEYPWGEWLAEALDLHTIPEYDDLRGSRALAAYALKQAKEGKLSWAIDLARLLGDRTPEELGLKSSNVLESFTQVLAALQH